MSSVMDIFRQKEKQKKKKEEDDNEEEKEQKKEAAEEGKEEVIASREGGTLAKPNNSDTTVEIMGWREGHSLEPGEEGGGSIPFPIPNPVSIKPNAMKGEINQGGVGRCLPLGVGKRNLGPIPNNVKPNPSLEEASEEGVPPV